MLENINIQINNIKNELAKKHVLEKKLKDFKKELSNSEEELIKLENTLIKEKKDVDKLKKLSLSSMVSTVIGNKDEKIEKEEQEYIMAKINYDRCKSKVNLLKNNIDDTISKLRKLENHEKKYEDLLKQKIALVNVYGNENTKNKILKIEATLDEYLKEIKEINESIYVGDKLIEEILEAKKLLDSAKTWSTLDILGGNLLSSMAKHNKIDEAQMHFSRISNMITSFNKELKDVNISGVDFSTTTKTFDIFFDNIFTDFSVDSHINQSYNSVCSLEKSINNILNELIKNKEYLNKEVKDIRSEYDEFVKSI